MSKKKEKSSKSEPFTEEIPFGAKDLLDLLGRELELVVYRQPRDGVAGALHEPTTPRVFDGRSHYHLGNLTSMWAETGPHATLDHFPPTPPKEAYENYKLVVRSVKVSTEQPPVIYGVVKKSDFPPAREPPNYRNVTLFLEETPKVKTLNHIVSF